MGKNELREALRSDFERLWDNLDLAEKEALMQRLRNVDAITEPEEVSSIVFARLGELSRMAAQMDIIIDFIFDKLGGPIDGLTENP